MKSFFALFVFLLACNTPLHAQVVPGYLGKRHFVEFGGVLGGNHFIGKQALHHQVVKGSFLLPLAIRPELTYNYVFSRNSTLQVGYAYSALEMATRVEERQQYFPSPEYRVFIHDVQVGINLHGKKMLAPIGGHFKLGLHFLSTNRRLLDTYAPKSTDPQDATPLAFTTIGFKFGYGYKAILSDRLFLSFDVQTIILPLALPFPATLDRVVTYPPYQNQLVSVLQERYVLGFKVSLGVFL